MPTVYIIIYSLYHHVYKVALSVQKGLEAEGVNVKIFQVPETLSDEILGKLHAPAKPDLPVITIDALTQADAFMFGIPTRFGTLPSQFKSFLDATGALWATGALSGKFVGTFFSTASQHGGQETTAYTLMTYFAHHGLNYVPLGFANSNLFDNSEVVGGSAYGAGTVANGDGSREPSQKELEIAQTQGENFAKILNTFHRGLDVIEANGGELSNKATTTANTADTTAGVAADSNNATSTTAMDVDKADDRIEEVDPSGNTAATAATTATTVGAAAGAAAAANAAGTADNVNKVSANTANATTSPANDSSAPATTNTTAATGATPATNNAATNNSSTANGTAATGNTVNASAPTQQQQQQQAKPAAAAAAAAAAPSKPISEKPAKKEKKKNDCFCM